jgi:hypothetical protein
LERIRDIRSSEKALYRPVLDLYATSVDYSSGQPETFEFFKIVQNKMHFAASKHTAAELIYSRADSEQPFIRQSASKRHAPAALCKAECPIFQHAPSWLVQNFV